MKEILINWLKKQRKISKIKSLPLRRQKDAPDNSGNAIKAELFSVDQMERYGQRLARSHKLATRKTPYYLLKRLDDNERTLAESCHQLSNGKKASMTPAGEWLLDNYYLIEEQIRVVRHHLPKTFGRGLPQLAPRITARGSTTWLPKPSRTVTVTGTPKASRGISPPIKKKSI